MSKCENHDGKFVETIEAYHQRVFQGKEYFQNNEIGGHVSLSYNCDCGIDIQITHRNIDMLPKHIQDKADILKANNDWFFA